MGLHTRAAKSSERQAFPDLLPGGMLGCHHADTARATHPAALHFAATKGRTDVIKLLLNSGLKVNAKMRNGSNALMIAAKHGAGCLRLLPSPWLTAALLPAACTPLIPRLAPGPTLLPLR